MTSRKFITASFVATVVIMISFEWVKAGIGDGLMLDVIMSGADARARVAEMTDAHRLRHMIGTGVIDTLYPIAYGAFFASSAARFASSKRWLLPALAAVLFDVLENTVQFMALAGGPDLLDLKIVLTPLKFGAVLVSAALALGLFVSSLMSREA